MLLGQFGLSYTGRSHGYGRERLGIWKDGGTLSDANKTVNYYIFYLCVGLITGEKDWGVGKMAVH